MTTTQEIEHILQSCETWNQGQGLIISKALAEALKELGINGPYTVRSQIDLLP